MDRDIYVSFGGVKEAYYHIRRIFDETPVIPLGERDADGRRVVVSAKLESAQATYSFKSRGAEFFVHSRVMEFKKGGYYKVPELVTASAGNHAQGVALAAKRYGLKAHIFMPRNTPEVKRERTEEKLGGEVHLVGTCFDNALEAALEYAQPRGRIFVPPYEHNDVIHGQGTIAVELLSRTCPYHDRYWRFYDYFRKNPWQVPDVVVAGVGGGGLTAGLGIVIKDFVENTGHNMRLVGVQSSNSDSMYRSFHAGTLLPSSTNEPTIADGINVKQASPRMLALAKRYVDDVVLVSDNEIKDAMRSLRHIPNLNGVTWYHREHASAGRTLPGDRENFSTERPLNRHEGASAASYAAVDKLDYDRLGISKKETVYVTCILTGSNIDAAKFDTLTA